MAIKKKPRQEDNELRWMTTYGDVVTLMMAFFVMLYAISQVDQRKFQLLVSGLATPFNNTSLQEGLLEGGNAIVGAASHEPEPGNDGIDGITVLNGMPSRGELEPKPAEQPPENPQPTLRTNAELIAVRDAVQAALEEAGVPTAVSFNLDKRGLVVAIATDGVLFPSGSASISERGREIISVIAPIFNEFDNEILVEGHTDSVPLNRAGYTNWDLSTDRALAVLKLLHDGFDVAPERLAAVGYGEYRPKATNETAAGKALNRRVELVIIADREGGDTNGQEEG